MPKCFLLDVWGDQVGSEVSCPAFHLCGARFKSNVRPEPCMGIGFLSPYLTVWVFPIGVFLQRLKLNISFSFLFILLLALIVLLGV